MIELGVAAIVSAIVAVVTIVVYGDYVRPRLVNMGVLRG